MDKVSETMQEATEVMRARFPDLREMLDDLGVQTGAKSPSAAVDPAVLLIGWILKDCRASQML